MPRRLRRGLAALIALLALALAAGCEWESLPDPGASGHVSDASLARLRSCESDGDYRAVSRSGTYRGAYQFSRSTWNATAAKWAPWLVGVDPAAAWPWEQDNMAAALFAEQGRSPWPHCGRHL